MLMKNDKWRKERKKKIVVQFISYLSFPYYLKLFSPFLLKVFIKEHVFQEKKKKSEINKQERKRERGRENKVKYY